MLADRPTHANVEIVADNLRAAQAIYFAHQLEEMRMFQVVERLEQLFQQGLLPLGRGQAARLLRQHAGSPSRLSEHERKHLYARVLGVPDGQTAASAVNRQFRTRWLRFMTTMALSGRVQGPWRWPVLRVAAAARRRSAARALAANVSVHGAGMLAATRRLSIDINRLRAVLQAPEILSAYGARDMWQVIEQVASSELGGARNVRGRRSLAHAGSAVLQWLADHADELNDPAAAGAVDGFQDSVLIHAVDQWLGASTVLAADAACAALTANDASASAPRAAADAEQRIDRR